MPGDCDVVLRSEFLRQGNGGEEYRHGAQGNFAGLATHQCCRRRYWEARLQTNSGYPSQEDGGSQAGTESWSCDGLDGNPSTEWRMEGAPDGTTLDPRLLPRPVLLLHQDTRAFVPWFTWIARVTCGFSVRHTARLTLTLRLYFGNSNLLRSFWRTRNWEVEPTNGSWLCRMEGRTDRKR